MRHGRLVAAAGQLPVAAVRGAVFAESPFEEVVGVAVPEPDADRVVVDRPGIKVARWDPDKPWKLAVESMAISKQQGDARGGPRWGGGPRR